MDDDFRQLSESQQIWLAILPIPSAILSVFGSVVIITMAFKSRQTKPWTPYHGLLTAMSVCDIILSITVALGSFLFPSAGSSYPAVAFGNDASCTATAFLSQFSASAFLYNAMLGFYFLLSTKVGLANREIADRFEPLMHFVALGFPLVTAFTGLFLNAYGERQGFLTCYIKTCPFDENGEREQCNLPILDLIFGRIVYVFVLGSLVINNLVILIFFQQQTRQARKRRKEAEANKRTRNDRNASRSNSRRSSFRSLGELSVSTPSTTTTAPVMSRRELQLERRERQAKEIRKRRVRLLSTQAFLFIGSFILCNSVSFVLRFVVGNKIILGKIPEHTMTYVEEMEFPYQQYSLMVAQAILYPLLGFINMLVYTRPKYAANRREFPNETRVWACKRAIFGESVTPLSSREEPKNSSMFGSIQLSPSTARAMKKSSSGREVSRKNSLVPIGEQDETDSISVLTPSNMNYGDDNDDNDDDMGSGDDNGDGLDELYRKEDASRSAIVIMDGTVVPCNSNSSSMSFSTTSNQGSEAKAEEAEG